MLFLGDWTINQSTLQATNQATDTTKALSPEMALLLAFMADNQHRLLSAEQLSEQAWPDNKNHEQNVEELIAQLQQIFGSSLIGNFDDKYLLSAPTFRYTYEQVKPDHYAVEVSKQFDRIHQKRQMLEIAQNAAQQKTESASKQNSITKLLIAVVIVGVILFISSQSF